MDVEIEVGGDEARLVEVLLDQPLGKLLAVLALLDPEIVVKGYEGRHTVLTAIVAGFPDGPHDRPFVPVTRRETLII